MENEKQLSEKESLDLITSMINKVKDSYHDTGWGPIMWGCVIIVCSLVTWARVQWDFTLPVDIWWLTLAAVIPQIIISTRENRAKQSKSYNDIALDYTWIGFGICIFLLSFAIGVIHYGMDKTFAGAQTAFKAPSHFLFNYQPALFMILYGLPTFVTGGIMKFNAMIFGGIFCWVCAVASLYTPAQTDLLLMAAAALFAWLIPGILINRRCLNKRRQQQHV